MWQGWKGFLLCNRELLPHASYAAVCLNSALVCQNGDAHTRMTQMDNEQELSNPHLKQAGCTHCHSQIICSTGDHLLEEQEDVVVGKMNSGLALARSFPRGRIFPPPFSQMALFLQHVHSHLGASLLGRNDHPHEIIFIFQGVVAF